MRILIPICKRVLSPLFALTVLAPGAAQAGSIQLTPVRVNLSDAAKVAVLTVRNTGSEKSVMQVTLKKWELDGGIDTYQQSQDLVITPVTFRLAPGAQQIVRVGLRNSSAQANEGAYRMLVEEVPAPLSSTVTQTRLVVRHDLPDFIAPAGPVNASLDISVECATGGGNLHVTNIGNVHAQLRNVVFESNPGKQVLAGWDTADYLLPTAQIRWDLTKLAPAAYGKPFTSK
jgi:fimbrial chaperone protein